ncbi:hypothetical protein [Streptomyces tubercidicus]|uniref:hypothetical protein n=1 Tax=Streptomyces tubercidicus TaxID=47759 RepID=UPI0036910444
MDTLKPQEATDEATERVIRWTRSKPVLTRCLRDIAREALGGLEDQELTCAVVALLDPNRNDTWRDILGTTGVYAADADAVWADLGGDTSGWMNRVHWQQVRQALLDGETVGVRGEDDCDHA